MGIVMLIVIAILVIAWYRTSRKVFDYWKLQGLPYIEPGLIGCPLECLIKPLGEVAIQHRKKYGRCYGTFEGRRLLLVAGEPELLRHILVKDFHFFTNRRFVQVGNSVGDNLMIFLEGEDWKRVRTIVSPVFSSRKIRQAMCRINECAQTLVRNITMAEEKKEYINCKKFFGAFTMDVIASWAFGTKLDSYNDACNPFVKNAERCFTNAGLPWRVLLTVFFPTVAKLLGVCLMPPENLAFFKSVTEALVERRKETVTPQGTQTDFLSLLLEAEEESSHGQPLDLSGNSVYIRDEMDHNKYAKTVKNKVLSSDELVAQCVIFFLAGYETSASLLSYTAYHLALNPECQDRLIQEIAETLANKEMTYETLNEMEYLDAVLAESLRICPIAIWVERLCAEDYTLPETNVVVPKDTLIHIPVYAIHHDPEFFPNPHRYIPDRFLPENRASVRPYTYFPFGGGPRACIGMRFALLETKLCLIHVLKNFTFHLCSKTDVPLQFEHCNPILNAKDVTLSVTSRV